MKQVVIWIGVKSDLEGTLHFSENGPTGFGSGTVYFSQRMKSFQSKHLPKDK